MSDAQVEWDQFEKAGKNLQDFLRTQRSVAPAGKTLYERPFSFVAGVASWLDQMDETLGSSLGIAKQMRDTPAGQLDLRLQLFEQTQTELVKLLALANSARAEGQAIGVFSEGSRKWSLDWQHLVLIAVISEAVVCFGLILFASRLVAIKLTLSTSAGTLQATRSQLFETKERLKESNFEVERQEKLAQKGRHAAELAHELHNPLTAINLRLYALQKTLSKGTGEHEDAAVIRKEIRRLNAILEDFLQLHDVPEPSFVPMSAEGALREVRDLLGLQLAENAIELKVDTVEDVRFRADPHQLQGVLINLIKNAAESIRHGGTVTLRARQDKAMLRHRQTEVVIIEVEDTGTGIPEEIQSHLGDAFFTTKKKGTGLGLSISERIVGKHGGVLDFYTKIDHGTTFRIVLPVEQPS